MDVDMEMDLDADGRWVGRAFGPDM